MKTESAAGSHLPRYAPPPDAGHLVLAALEIGVRRQGSWLVQAVDLWLSAGEVLVLLGANGAGKSTLLKCLAGELHPDQGHVRLRGQPLGQWRAVLQQGWLLAVGAPQDVLQPGPIQDAFGLPVRVLPHPDLDCPLIIPRAGVAIDHQARRVGN